MQLAVDILVSWPEPIQVPQHLPTVHAVGAVGILKHVCQQRAACLWVCRYAKHFKHSSFWEVKIELNHCTLKCNREERLPLLLPLDLAWLKALASWGRGEWRLETRESALEKHKDNDWAAPRLITQPLCTGLGQCCNSCQIFWLSSSEVPISSFPSFLINFR